MNIGAIGWWNYDNQGDLAMLSALCQGLAPHRVVPIDIGFPAHRDAISRLNGLDYVILGGGTLISGRPDVPFDTFDRWADQLGCPLGVVGLGVDPIIERHWPAVQALLSRAQFVYVRDRISRALLRDHPRAQIAPDLSFAHPLPAREYGSELSGAIPVCGVNLRRAPGLDVAPWLEAIAQLPVKLRGIPLSSFHVWTEHALLSKLDPACPDHFDAALYRQLGLMIGTAYHSILFAVQAAVPVIAIEYAPKVRHFMEDNGLTRYLLSPDEHHRLPSLVEDVLAHRSQIVGDLRAIRERLHQQAQQNLARIREQIELGAERCRGSRPKVTIMVLGTGNEEKDERTLLSCVSQTYGNVEVLLSTRGGPSALSCSAGASGVTTISADPQASAGARVQQMLVQSGGQYVTWVDGGDWFARDALDCLVSRLAGERQPDMVYSDYYVIDEANTPLGYQTALGPDRLFRRDVVGPCFLMRKKTLVQTGPCQPIRRSRPMTCG
jgi:polysaccharide pyruvyl transferase WcaK-like protein